MEWLKWIGICLCVLLYVDIGIPSYISSSPNRDTLVIQGHEVSIYLEGKNEN